MPQVPVYSQQVAPTGLSNNTFAPAVAQDATGQQLQQAGDAMQRLGGVGSSIAQDMENKAAQTRLDDSANKLEMEIHRLTFDKEAGLANQKGENALKRPGGIPLADEYTGKLNDYVGKLSGELSNDTQRRAFAARANHLVSTFYGRALKHEAEQANVLGEATDHNTLKNRMGDISNNFNNLALVNEAINGRVDEQGNVISKGIKQVVASIAQRNGHPAEWQEATTKAYIADAHKDVVMRMMDTDPVAAQDYLNKNMAAIGGNAPALQRTLRPAVDRAKGEAKGATIYRQGGPVSADSNNVIDWVIKIEGGYVANDAGKGETNFGINKTANPDIDIKNLTPDQAKAIYKDRYWDAIKADSLPKEMRAIAFDTAVNQGVGTANRLLAQANGDPQKMVDLRRAEYQKLIESNPGKYKRFEGAWMSRLDQLQGLAASGGDRSLAGMLKQADQIEDREQRNIATSVINHSYKVDEMARKETYDNNFNKAQDAAFAKPGGWREIQPSVWAAIKPEDREKLRAGLPKQSDSDTLLMLQENPQLWKAGQIEQYRAMLSETDYRNFHGKANGPLSDETIRAATIDVEQFNNGMVSAGLEKTLHARKGSDEQKILINLRAKYEQVIDAEQTAKGRKLSLDEKNGLLTRLLKPVQVNMMTTGSLFGMLDGRSVDDKRAFQVKNPASIRIPEASRSAIEADMRKRGINPSPDRILNAYLASEEPKK